MSSTQFPSDLRPPLLKLSKSQSFTANLPVYLASAIEILSHPIPPSEPLCPSALLLSISHCLSHNLSLQSIALLLDQPVREHYLKCLEDLDLRVEDSEQTGFRGSLEELVDVGWTLDIGQGREIWNVTLIFESGVKQTLKLNYEQLSVLVFQLGQAVGYVKGVQL